MSYRLAFAEALQLFAQILPGTAWPSPPRSTSDGIVPLVGLVVPAWGGFSGLGVKFAGRGCGRLRVSGERTNVGHTLTAHASATHSEQSQRRALRVVRARAGGLGGLVPRSRVAARRHDSCWRVFLCGVVLAKAGGVGLARRCGVVPGLALPSSTQRDGKTNAHATVSVTSVQDEQATFRRALGALQRETAGITASAGAVWGSAAAPQPRLMCMSP